MSKVVTVFDVMKIQDPDKYAEIMKAQKKEIGEAATAADEKEKLIIEVQEFKEKIEDLKKDNVAFVGENIEFKKEIKELKKALKAQEAQNERFATLLKEHKDEGPNKQKEEQKNEDEK